jgi:hypothetical protein
VIIVLCFVPTSVGVVYWIHFVANYFTAAANCADCKGGCGAEGIKDGNKGVYNDGLQQMKQVFHLCAIEWIHVYP